MQAAPSAAATPQQHARPPRIAPSSSPATPRPVLTSPLTGRPMHPLFAFFKIVVPRSKKSKQNTNLSGEPKDKPHPDVECIQCQKYLRNAQTSRNMIKHVIACSGISEDEKAPWRKVDAERRERQRQALRTPQKKRRRLTPLKITFGTPRIASSAYSTPQSTPHKTTKQTKEENFKRVAMGFYATGIPFRIVEDPFFRAMFDYELPSRRQLAERLLDGVYKDEQQRIKEDLIGASHLAVVSDGWSSPNHDQIINVMLAKPNMKPVFWKSFPTQDASHTSAYIAEKLGDAIDEIESEIGSGAVSAVVTDNASNMRGAWKLLEQERPGLLCSGCAAHGLNLLVKDVCSLDDLGSTLKQSTTLSRFVRSRDALWSRFRELQNGARQNGSTRRRLSLPVPTRWYTQEKCIRNVVENKDVIAATFSDNTLLSTYKREPAKLKEAVSVVQDPAFWSGGAVALTLLNPITSALAKFEEENCCISNVYHEFEKLLSNKAYTHPIPGCSVNLQRRILERIESRREFVCRPPIVIANFLDQTKSFYGAVEADLISTISQATQMARRLGYVVDDDGADEFHRQLVEFAMTKRNWSDEERKMHAQFAAIAWWTFTNRFPDVQPFALQLLSIPTSSASSERSWSVHTFLHTKTRNRLSPERLNKLVFVYSNMARRTEPDQLVYQLFPDSCDDIGSDTEESMTQPIQDT